jgi:hypothetical protein
MNAGQNYVFAASTATATSTTSAQPREKTHLFNVEMKNAS